MNAPGDLYNPTAEAAEDAKSIPGARYVVIPSLQGHFAASPAKVRRCRVHEPDDHRISREHHRRRKKVEIGI